MAEDTKYLNPQTILTAFGLFMAALALIGLVAVDSNELPPFRYNSDIQLKVEPSTGSPKSVLNQLQGAGGLQSQGNEDLQRPLGEQLQPNAKTDNINPTQTVQ